MRAVTAVAVLGVGLGGAVGPAGAQELEVGGEVRPRFEVRDPVPAAGSGEQALEFTSMRTRVSVGTFVAEGVRVFAQLQDVRVWGSEAGTTDPSAEGLDLHQGWIELGDADAGVVAVRVGRQELSYGGQRLIGALNWAQQARSFDGVRVRVRGSGLVVDGFVAQVGDYDAGSQPDEALVGAYGRAESLGLEGYVLYHDRDGRIGGVEGVPQELSKKYTVGGRWVGGARGLDWRLEAAYQLGDARLGPERVADVSAYLVGARIGTALGDAVAVSVWYDRLSGDDDPGDGELRVFDTLFATNHKFYGLMDLFLNIPVHTAGRGLQDLALKAAADLSPGHSLGADLHAFRYAAAGGLDSGRLGEELDLTYRWRYAPAVGITAGASYFRAAGSGGLPAAPAMDDGQVWGYVMMDVVF